MIADLPPKMDSRTARIVHWTLVLLGFDLALIGVLAGLSQGVPGEAFSALQGVGIAIAGGGGVGAYSVGLRHRGAGEPSSAVVRRGRLAREAGPRPLVSDEPPPEDAGT